MTNDELEVELRKLDPRERARLAAVLLNSLEELSDDENARLWAEEAERRHDDLLADKTLTSDSSPCIVVEHRHGRALMKDSANLHAPAMLNSIREDIASIAFTMSSDDLTGSLLRMLAASKPRGSLLELGTGAGVSTAWLLDGMDPESRLITVENDPRVHAMAKRHLGADPRATFVLVDGEPFIESHRHERFDLVFADTWPGKFYLVDEVLGMLRWGGLYIVDDLLPVDSWSPEHAKQVVQLVSYLGNRSDLLVTKLSWSTGLLVATKVRD